MASPRPRPSSPARAMARLCATTPRPKLSISGRSTTTMLAVFRARPQIRKDATMPRCESVVCKSGPKRSTSAPAAPAPTMLAVPYAATQRPAVAGPHCRRSRKSRVAMSLNCGRIVISWIPSRMARGLASGSLSRTPRAPDAVFWPAAACCCSLGPAAGAAVFARWESVSGCRRAMLATASDARPMAMPKGAVGPRRPMAQPPRRLPSTTPSARKDATEARARGCAAGATTSLTATLAIPMKGIAPKPLVTHMSK
mmetsp:Transcript_42949/g.115778  ORF Transcript_42949/g.115778 Transcript_42949/m.115778 type:complete len:255 (-) Transcript_42949:373-1137(-)